MRLYGWLLLVVVCNSCFAGSARLGHFRVLFVRWVGFIALMTRCVALGSGWYCNV